MTIGDSFTSAIRAIGANKLRSALTMLGVVIGVGSVITMIGIGEGTKQKSIENLEIMGSKMITVVPDWSLGPNRPRLEREDIEAIERGVPEAEFITGSMMERGQSASYGGNSMRASIIAGEPQMAIIRNATKMHQGGWFDTEDDVNMRQVAVLGFAVYDELFEGENAIGAQVRLGSQSYEVVGVVDFKGGDGWMNPDENIYIPLRTAQQRLLGRTNVDMIIMQAKYSNYMLAIQDKVEQVLAVRHPAPSPDVKPFRVFNQGEQLQQLEEQNKLLGTLLASIASVSLLVGGIGIMNIMLVSVTERTREIGLRKAIGAKREGIVTQFLLESVIMCLFGGAIGIVLGAGAIRYVAEALKVDPIVNQQAVVVAFTFSVLIGVFFGLYPAIKASALQPIEALRHE